jgi:cytochrome c553
VAALSGAATGDALFGVGMNKRERSNDNAVMHGIASKLTDLELKAVAAYLSGLQ